MTGPGVAVAKATFSRERAEMTRLAAEFVDGPAAVVAAASDLFDSMIPSMAYLDNPKHPMAVAVFGCSATLALYRVLEERGVDVHEFGSAYLDGFARTWAERAKSSEESDSGGSDDEESDGGAAFAAAAAASQRDARPGEFVFAIARDPGPDATWGMNIKSCGICYQFSKHDAMDLVPYMCATDDVMSDQADSGLRRTGTIALGAHQCDFRYKRGGEPRRLAEQYPERIQIGRRRDA